MARVMKPNGSIILISFGSPEERKRYFEEALGFENYSYFYFKKNLSEVAMLINIMRANSNNMPLVDVFKNKLLFLKVYMEYQ